MELTALVDDALSAQRLEKTAGGILSLREQHHALHLRTQEAGSRSTYQASTKTDSPILPQQVDLLQLSLIVPEVGSMAVDESDQSSTL